MHARDKLDPHRMEASRDGARRRDADAALARIAEGGPYPVVVGINTRNVETTILHVLNVVCEGLQQHYGDTRCLVVVCDGGSDDQTLDLAEFYPAPRGIRKVVVTQRGGRGKGNGVRTILEAARAADARACAFVDGDLVSIRPIWVDKLLRPVVHGLSDLVVPYYLRDKWDGVITNHLCYPFTAALYGSSVRQPIGGDFGLSRRFLERLLAGPLPEGFGIDIHLTTTALAEDLRVQEAPLGIKIHASTTSYVDPRKTLSGMYVEVVGAMLDAAARYEPRWRAPGYGAPVLLSEAVVPYYDRLPPPTLVEERNVRALFREGTERSRATLDRAIGGTRSEMLRSGRESGIGVDEWARAAYALAAWHVARPGELPPEAVPNALGALGMGRFLDFVRATRTLGLEDAHTLIQEQAQAFQRLRPEFLRRVDELRDAATARPAGVRRRAPVRRDRA